MKYHVSKPEVVKAIIYAGMISHIVSRRLFAGYRQATARVGVTVTDGRWVRFFVEHAGHILREVPRRSGIQYTETLLWELALHEFDNPTPIRERLHDVWDA